MSMTINREINKTRGTLYHSARALGDVQAALKGPVPLGRRLVRKAVYRHVNGETRQLLKALGL